MSPYNFDINSQNQNTTNQNGRRKDSSCPQCGRDADEAGPEGFRCYRCGKYWPRSPLLSMAVGIPNQTEKDLESKPGTYIYTPFQVRLQEVDASEMVAEGVPEEPESLPVLGRTGYVITNWSHILAGYPKAGKTETLFASVTEWVKAGVPVLWLSEESRYVWQQRLSQYPDLPQGLTLVFAIGADPDVLLERASKGPEEVVIVDTIRNLLRFKDENDNSIVSSVLGEWEHSLQNKTRIYVHHLRKMSGEHGQGIAGGGAFLGIVDRSLELQFDPHDKKRRQLVVTSRIFDVPDLMIEMGEAGLIALGDPADVSLTETKKRVLEVLDNTWRTTNEMAGLLGEPKPSSRQVREALNTMFRGHNIQREPVEDTKGATYRWRV